MKLIPLTVERLEGESFRIEYRNKVDNTNFLIFPISGYSTKMRHVGKPVFTKDGDLFIIYDYDKELSYGDNTFPRKGDQVAWMLMLDDDRLDKLEDEVKKLQQQQSTPKVTRKKKEK